MSALGDTGAIPEGGAFAMLQRLVEGGILTALSTTVVGGVGGYVLRVIKALSVGVELERYYASVTGKQGDEIYAALSSIRASLRALLEPGRRNATDERFGLESR